MQNIWSAPPASDCVGNAINLEVGTCCFSRWTNATKHSWSCWLATSWSRGGPSQLRNRLEIVQGAEHIWHWLVVFHPPSWKICASQPTNQTWEYLLGKIKKMFQPVFCDSVLVGLCFLFFGYDPQGTYVIRLRQPTPKDQSSSGNIDSSDYKSHNLICCKHVVVAAIWFLFCFFIWVPD